MSDVTGEPWFWWAVALAVGLPLALLVLTELHGWLARRGSALAAPVATLRNFAVPAGALLILLTKAWDISGEETWVRLIATVFGFLVLVLALSALNVALFGNAATGTWRERMPSIFVDIVRLVLIVAGLAVLFAWVWGANVGGLFAALGVTSIVLGFALQNAVGSIVSGLLLLFEQPFRLGDWLDTGSVRGRVVEVNWRSVHIETGNGIQIVPNANLAGSEFTNLSQPAGAHEIVISHTFGTNDRPEVVRTLLDGTAANLPSLHPDFAPHTEMTGPKSYATTLTTRSPSEASAVAATFQRWAWYAARRAGLHLDGGSDDTTPADVETALRSVATTLLIDESDVEALAAGMRLERWASGELVQRAGTVPDGLRFLVAGAIAVHVAAVTGRVRVADLAPGDYFGQSTLTREPILADGTAIGELTTLFVPQAVIDDLVRNRSALARQLGEAIDLRRRQVQEATGAKLRALAG